MKGWGLVVVGGLLMLAGAVWALQGFDVLGGSAMSGQSVWAVIGPIVAVVGLVLLVTGSRRIRRAHGSPSRR
jgi:ACR3 family arsenite efflux pump ArsB